MPNAKSGVSVVVPTFREAPNVEPLVRRVFAALGAAGQGAELILVDDDSQDGTDRIVSRLAAEFPVRIIVRRGERGLSSAVVRGLEQAQYDRLVVLDADLQHPPELIPELVKQLDGAEFVMATRYSGTGSLAEDWPWRRRVASRLATLLAGPLCGLSDPMSGFFALRRETWERAAPRVDPIGYKIGLELFVKSGRPAWAEAPIAFAARCAGQSKLGLGAQWAYVRHLLRLYRFRFPRTLAAARLAIITAAALFILLFA